MLKERDPRLHPDLEGRVKRMGSALAFLLLALLFLGLSLLSAYLSVDLHWFSRENPLVPGTIFGFALLSGCAFVGSIYLLFHLRD